MLGALPQYASFLINLIEDPRVQFSSLYGPVPTGFAMKSGFVLAIGGTTFIQYMRAGRIGSGPLVITSTVKSSIFLASVIAAKYEICFELNLGSMIRLT